MIRIRSVIVDVGFWLSRSPHIHDVSIVRALLPSVQKRFELAAHDKPHNILLRAGWVHHVWRACVNFGLSTQPTGPHGE